MVDNLLYCCHLKRLVYVSGPNVKRTVHVDCSSDQSNYMLQFMWSVGATNKITGFDSCGLLERPIKLQVSIHVVCWSDQSNYRFRFMWSVGATNQITGFDSSEPREKQKRTNNLLTLINTTPRVRVKTTGNS